MTRARDLAVVAGLLLWWSPALVLTALCAVPHLAARHGAPYRFRRVRRLVDRGRVGKAERVAAAIRRDLDVTSTRRSAGARGFGREDGIV